MVASMTFVDFNRALFRLSANEPEPLREKDILLRSLVYRPTIFQRKDVRWIAAHTWRSQAKERGIRALKAVKNDFDPVFIKAAAEPISALIRELFGSGPAHAVTCIPCGHSCRADCFGKLLAQAVALGTGMPFIQVFADRHRAGVSHPKQSTKLPPLRQIARPPGSTIIIDDVATSGEHLEQAVLALRRVGIAASAFAWISGSTVGGSPFRDNATGVDAEGTSPVPAQIGLKSAATAARGGEFAPSGKTSAATTP